MRMRSSASTLVFIALTALAACETEKSSSPLSPTVAGPIGYNAVLAILTGLGVVGSIWLAHATSGMAASRSATAPVSQ